MSWLLVNETVWWVDLANSKTGRITGGFISLTCVVGLLLGIVSWSTAISACLLIFLTIVSVQIVQRRESLSPELPLAFLRAISLVGSVTATPLLLE